MVVVMVRHLVPDLIFICAVIVILLQAAMQTQGPRMVVHVIRIC